ncbi:MAG: cytochrome c, partial [Nitrospina sp.]|nr:cytochrome c [Nitrospina sp.]
MKVFFTVLLSLFLVSEAFAVKSYKGYSKLPEPPATSKGESIYKESDCSMCHGEMGDGEGFLAAGLEPKPRDFTNFLQMNTVTDMSMINAIQDGLKGTAMPAHPDFNEEQIGELILYLRSLIAETYLTLNV